MYYIEQYAYKCLTIESPDFGVFANFGGLIFLPWLISSCQHGVIECRVGKRHLYSVIVSQ